MNCSVAAAILQCPALYADLLVRSPAVVDRAADIKGKGVDTVASWQSMTHS